VTQPTRDRLLLVCLCALAVTAGCLGASVERDGTGVGGDTNADETAVRVTDVVDGDTVDVRFANGSEDTVRLLGVDTPEVHVENDPDEFEGVPDTEMGRSCLRSQGEAASSFAVDRLADKQVTLRFDPLADRRGGYGRLLAYVVVGNETFNAALLERGHARLYDSEFQQRDEYAALEREARENGRGVWSCAS